MVSHIRLFSLMALTSFILLLACSSNDSPTKPGTVDPTVELLTYGDALAQIAPPVFTSAPATLPAANDSFWFAGEYPAIGKAFGNQETQSLYKNIRFLDDAVMMADLALQYGNITDSLISNGQDTATVTIVTHDLTAPIAVPTGCEGILGTDPISLEKFCRLTFSGGSQDSTYIAFTRGDSTQTFLIWEYWPASLEMNCGPTTIVFYAYYDQRTDSVDFRGALYRTYEGDYRFRSIWRINTAQGDNFDYSMIFHGTGVSAPEPGEYNGLAGGGDKDSLFVLRALGFNPETFVIDPESSISSQFGPNYEYLGDLIPEELSTYVADIHYFSPAVLPSAHIPNPFAE